MVKCEINDEEYNENISEQKPTLIVDNPLCNISEENSNYNSNQEIAHKKKVKLIKTKTETTNNVCNQCGHEFTDKSSLKKHIKTVHEGIKRFKCTQCGWATNQSYDFKRDILSLRQLNICDLHDPRNLRLCVVYGPAFLRAGRAQVLENLT